MPTGAPARRGGRRPGDERAVVNASRGAIERARVDQLGEGGTERGHGGPSGAVLEREHELAAHALVGHEGSARRQPWRGRLGGCRGEPGRASAAHHRPAGAAGGATQRREQVDEHGLTVRRGSDSLGGRIQLPTGSPPARSGGSAISGFFGTDKWHDDVVRVVVVDDHALLRRRLLIQLEEQPDLDVIAEAGDGEQAIALCRGLAPDVVVVGMRVERIGGPRTAAGIREVVPSAHLVMLVSADDEADSVRAINAGAAGFVNREGIERAPAVVRAVAGGMAVLPPAVAERVLAEYHSLGRQAGSVQQRITPPTLDEREAQLLRHLADGATVVTAADAVGVAAGTAKNLLTNAVEKLYRHARTESVLAAAGDRVTRPGDRTSF